FAVGQAGTYETVREALSDWRIELEDQHDTTATIEITDSRVYSEDLSRIALAKRQTLNICASNGTRPVLHLTGKPLVVQVDSGSRFNIGGIIVANRGLIIRDAHSRGSTVPAEIGIRHCTLSQGLLTFEHSEVEGRPPKGGGRIAEPYAWALFLDKTNSSV